MRTFPDPDSRFPGQETFTLPDRNRLPVESLYDRRGVCCCRRLPVRNVEALWIASEDQRHQHQAPSVIPLSLSDHSVNGLSRMVALAVERLYAAEAEKDVGGRPAKGAAKLRADLPEVKSVRATGGSANGSRNRFSNPRETHPL